MACSTDVTMGAVGVCPGCAFSALVPFDAVETHTAPLVGEASSVDSTAAVIHAP
jgi:hypothetical protein